MLKIPRCLSKSKKGSREAGKQGSREAGKGIHISRGVQKAFG
jgi:hypothetical protein